VPSHPIHLAQSPTARGWAKSIGTSAKDAQIINGVLEVSTNNVLGNKTVYVVKRSGSAARASTPTASGLVALKHYSSRFDQLYATTTALYSDSTNIGTLTGLPTAVSNYQLCDTVISNVGVLGFVTSDHAGWVLYENAISTNFPTFTGNRTSGSAIISGIASTTGIYKGQAVSGTGIAAGSRVLSVDSSTQITLTANATSGSGTSTTITKEAVSKILDANFPSDATNMETMDGYFFVGTAQGIRNTPINDPFTWDTDKLIAADYVGDDVILIFKIGDFICASGEVGNIQYFHNGGNGSGSILSRDTNLTVVGMSCVHRPTQHAGGTYFIGQEAIDSTLTRGFYRINGVNSIEPVSDDVWSGIITDQSLSFASPITNGNKSLIALHSSAVSTFPVYDPVLNAFTLFNIDAALTSAFRLAYTKSGTSTAIDWAQGNTWTDSGSSFTATVQTEPQDMSGGLSATDVWADLLADTESTVDYGGCNFDGSTDYFDGNALTGIADGKKGSIVAVVRFANSAGSEERIMTSTGSSITFRRLASGAISVAAENSGGTVILSAVDTSQSVFDNAGTYVIMASWDLSTPGSLKVYVNGAALTMTEAAYTNDTIDYTVSEYAIGATETGLGKLTGDIYFLWFDPTTNLDFSDAAVRDRFPTQTSGKFVGVNGELPTGTQPILFLGYGSGTGWAVNRGSATSTFTTNGTPVAATTSYTGENVAGFFVTDNDYQTWVHKGNFDLTQDKKRKHRLGYHKGPRAYKLQHCLNSAFRAQLLRINFNPAVV
jgi:hypothetical protein